MLSRGTLLGLLVTCLSVAPIAQAAPPEGGDRVRVNGVRLELRRLVLQGDPEALARRLEGRWGQRQSLPGSSGRPRAAFGRQRGPFHESLSLSAGPAPGSSLAIVAVQDLREPPAPLPSAPLPLPAAARVVNVVQFGEAGTLAASFTIDAPGSPDGTVRRLWRAAASRGWKRIASPAPAGTTGAAFWARRGVRQLTVVALPIASRSRVVMLESSDAPELRR